MVTRALVLVHAGVAALWLGWLRRVFALPAELPALQRRFRAAALAMFALVGTAFAVSYLW